MEEQNIQIPQPIHVKNIHRKLDTLAENNAVKNWFGFNSIDTLFYLYLFNKYKHNCLLKFKGLSNSFLGLELIIKSNKDIPIEQLNASEKHVTQIARQLTNCIKKGLPSIIIPLYLKFYNNVGHANLLIYRKKDNVIEHFEPHGTQFGLNPQNVQKSINTKLDEFISILNKELPQQSQVQLIRSNDVCPFFNGFQRLEEQATIPKLEIQGDGYCAAWSMFFTELALKNPTFSSNELINIIYDKLNQLSEKDRTNYMRKIIVGYVNLIHDKVEKYFSIIFGKHISVDTIIQIHKEKKDPSMFHTIQLIIDIETALLNDPSLTKEDYLQYIKRKIKNTTNISEKKKLLAQENMLEHIDILLNASPISEQTKSLSKDKSPSKKSSSSISSVKLSSLSPSKSSPKSSSKSPSKKSSSSISSVNLSSLSPSKSSPKSSSKSPSKKSSSSISSVNLSSLSPSKSPSKSSSKSSSKSPSKSSSQESSSSISSSKSSPKTSSKSSLKSSSQESNEPINLVELNTLFPSKSKSHSQKSNRSSFFKSAFKSKSSSPKNITQKNKSSLTNSVHSIKSSINSLTNSINTLENVSFSIDLSTKSNSSSKKSDKSLENSVHSIKSSISSLTDSVNTLENVSFSIDLSTKSNSSSKKGNNSLQNSISSLTDSFENNKSESSSKSSNKEKSRCENKKLKSCSETQIRNQITCRCNNITTKRKVKKVGCENKKLKSCSEKQIRNQITCRCNKIKVNNTRKRKICEPEKLGPCTNNRVRNSVTCRCRKIKV